MIKEGNIRFLKTAGNKFKYIDVIRKEIDKIEKPYVYVEPFLGSGSILINCIDDDIISYGFDSNENIINIFKHFKDINYEELEHFYNTYVLKFGNIGKEKEAYYSYRNEIYNKLYYKNNNKYSSMALYYLIRSCINSMIRFGPNGFNQSFGNRGRDIYLTKESLDFYKEKTKSAKFSCINFFDIPTKLFDNKNILWFLDPPYVGMGHVSYQDNFSKDNFEKFIDIITNKIKGKILYTDTWNEIHDIKLKNWRRIVLNKRLLTISPQLKKKNVAGKVEYLYCNF